MGRTMTWMWLMMACTNSDAAIIASDPVDINSLTVPELRLIFSRQQMFWPDGRQIRVFVLPPDSSLHKRFCAESLGVLPYFLKRNWDRQALSGTAEQPEVVNTIEEMKAKVRDTPGAIGYVPDPVEKGGGIQ